MQRLLLKSSLALLLFIIISSNSYAKPVSKKITGNAGSILLVESFATFNEPWAMSFLPSGDLLITEKKR